jgi:hypothetical protein
MYIFTLSYFYYTKELIAPQNQLLGVNKILLGSTLGLLSILFGNWLYQFLKTRNGGKTVFPYAKVVFPFSTILLVTLIFKFSFQL